MKKIIKIISFLFVLFVILNIYLYLDGFGWGTKGLTNFFNFNEESKTFFRHFEKIQNICKPILSENNNFKELEEKMESCLEDAPPTFAFSATIVVKDKSYSLKNLKNAGLFSVENSFKNCFEQITDTLALPSDVSIKTEEGTWLQEDKIDLVRQNGGAIKFFSQTDCVTDSDHPILFENEEPIRGVYPENEKIYDNLIQQKLLSCDAFLPQTLVSQSLIASFHEKILKTDSGDDKQDECAVRFLSTEEMRPYETCLCSAFSELDANLPKITGPFQFMGKNLDSRFSGRNNWFARIVSDNNKPVFYLLDKLTQKDL